MDRDRPRLRPVDLAREHGLSTQAVRNYEADGVLPPSERTPSGHRVYRPHHADALRAFLALVPAHGHAAAAAIMCAVNGGDVDTALALVDDGHARLREDRETLAAVDRAVRDLADRAAAPDAMPAGLLVGSLAHRLGVHPATLRKWERAGLVVPARDPRTGYRTYTTADVRDARLVHQLRRGGYPLAQIAPVVEQIRAAGGVEALTAALAGWRRRLTARGRAMLVAAAALAACVPDDPDTAPGTWPPRPPG
ncbi:TioE family transcriptional regulator [Pseudonocardia lacus]|uniref:TioE family transcriptional regulator n=1 Tax=Pseudonocardia lacus TaxID=2835865 RepID=UPI0027E2D388|nr:TioE family transcriptional regulator [Pseudonocardia lacus]